MTRNYFLGYVLFHASLYAWARDRYLEIILDKMGIPKAPGEQGETA